MKSWKIHFALKKGETKKFKPQLEYIQKTYKPEYLTIAQTKYFDLWRSKPMPIIEFIVYAFDPIHFMDDFIDKFPKLLMTGGAEEYKWMKIPKKVRTLKIEKIMDAKKRRGLKIAEKMRRRYKMRLKK